MSIRVSLLASLIVSLIGCGLVRQAESEASRAVNLSVSHNKANIWKLQVSGVTSQLNDIHFIDQVNGWAVGETGTIVVTSNGGVT